MKRRGMSQNRKQIFKRGSRFYSNNMQKNPFELFSITWSIWMHIDTRCWFLIITIKTVDWWWSVYSVCSAKYINNMQTNMQFKRISLQDLVISSGGAADQTPLFGLLSVVAWRRNYVGHKMHKEMFWAAVETRYRSQYKRLNLRSIVSVHGAP